MKAQGWYGEFSTTRFHVIIRSPANARAELSKMISEEEIIVFGEKARLTVVAALNDARGHSTLGQISPVGLERLHGA